MNQMSFLGAELLSLQLLLCTNDLACSSVLKPEDPLVKGL